MSVAWLRQAAEAFWATAGAREPFPRDLETAVLWALRLPVRRVSGLRVEHVRTWLTAAAAPCPVAGPERALRGCLVAFGGGGVIFLDADDPADERRFTLAHEAAHFLRDHLLPRQRALARLGPMAVEVLDGRRPPTVAERVDAVLADVPLGIAAYLMEREADSDVPFGRVSAAEDGADRLALELLAPADEVWRRLVAEGMPTRFAEKAGRTGMLLAAEFGLPAAAAEVHGRELCETWFAGPTLRERLGL